MAEGYEYQVHFKAGANDFSLTVTLTSEFPNEKPILKISPVVVHQWVGTDGEITGAPGLLNVSVLVDNVSAELMVLCSSLSIRIWGVWFKQ